jgi:hypothetical protein
MGRRILMPELFRILGELDKAAVIQAIRSLLRRRLVRIAGAAGIER